MRNLPELLRNLFYHLGGGPRQAGGLLTTVVLGVTGYKVATSGNGFSLLDNVQHVLHVMIYLIGSAVVLNIILKHGNELLARLIDEGRATGMETRRTVNLLRTLVGLPPKDDEATPSDSKSDTEKNSHNSQ